VKIVVRRVVGRVAKAVSLGVVNTQVQFGGATKDEESYRDCLFQLRLCGVCNIYIDGAILIDIDAVLEL
jgi:hypothetical protein